jgi:hypothetical protein
MKRFIIFLSVICIQTSAMAQLLEAKPFKDVRKVIQTTQLNFKQIELAFGFDTIKSCFYVSDNLIVIKNYCSPKKNYPAKGYTIISPKFGLIELYQERMGQLLKRDVRINAFPELVREYISGPMNSLSAFEINEILESIHYRYSPGCWSTNFSMYTEKSDARCSAVGVLDFELWAEETQSLVANEKNWMTLIDELETQFGD